MQACVFSSCLGRQKFSVIYEYGYRPRMLCVDLVLYIRIYNTHWALLRQRFCLPLRNLWRSQDDIHPYETVNIVYSLLIMIGGSASSCWLHPVIYILNHRKFAVDAYPLTQMKAPAAIPHLLVSRNTTFDLNSTYNDRGYILYTALRGRDAGESATKVAYKLE
jgi:hypothetical protein